MMRRPADHSSRLARGELADPERAEALERADRDSMLRRRDFLGRTAALAGLAGMGSLLPTETLIAEAAKHARRKPFPKPRDLPIDTFVVLMMENRSFDHYFGWHPKADAMNAGLSYPNLDHTQSFPTHRLTPDFQGCEFRDPNHGWDGGRFQYNGGKLDGFYSGNAEGTGSDEYALGYYLKADLPFIPHAAAAYQLYDRYFCSIMASTYPNRHYQMAAQNGGQKSNEFPTGANGFEWETIFDRALSRGPGSRLLRVRPAGARALRPARPGLGTAGVAVLHRRRRGPAAADHVHRPAVQGRGRGQRDLGRRAPARRRSPRSGVHVRRRARVHRGAAVPARRAVRQLRRVGRVLRPRQAPPRARRPRQPRRPHRGLVADRLPHPRGGGLALHPPQEGRPRQPHDLHARVDPEADLLPLRARLPEQAPPLRVEHRPQFDFSKRNFDPPELPDPAAIAATPCSLGGSQERPKQHDLVSLETSGLLDRLGYQVPNVTYDSLFRYPDRVRRAFEVGNGKGPR